MVREKGETYSDADTVCHGSYKREPFGRVRHPKNAAQTPTSFTSTCSLTQTHPVVRSTMFLDSLVNRTSVVHLYRPISFFFPWKIRSQHGARTTKDVPGNVLGTPPFAQTHPSFQSSHLPIYMRPPRARLYLGRRPFHYQRPMFTFVVRDRDIL